MTVALVSVLPVFTIPRVNIVNDARPVIMATQHWLHINNHMARDVPSVLVTRRAHATINTVMSELVNVVACLV